MNNTPKKTEKKEISKLTKKELKKGLSKITGGKWSGGSKGSKWYRSYEM